MSWATNHGSPSASTVRTGEGSLSAIDLTVLSIRPCPSGTVQTQSKPSGRVLTLDDAEQESFTRNVNLWSRTCLASRATQKN
jgi:hypothetical protein